MFLMNVLCAMVPCDYKNPHPEIGIYNDSDNSVSGVRHSLLGNNREKRLIQGASHPVVSTQQGQVQGYPMRVMSGRQIYAFEGIPYGQVTKRFDLAQPAHPWKGVRTAFAPGSHCLQIHPAKMFRVIGSENCLFLNIYTPKVTS